MPQFLSEIPPIVLYLLIFFAKLLEVSVATIRIVLTSKGHRFVAPLIAAFEVTIWLLITSTVLAGMMDDPLRAVAFILGFVAGIYLGILLEDKLALGIAQIEIIAEFEHAKKIAKELRSLGYGLTSFESEGMDGKKLTLVTKVLRKCIPSTMKILNEHKNILVTITEIKKISIGNIGNRIFRSCEGTVRK